MNLRKAIIKAKQKEPDQEERINASVDVSMLAAINEVMTFAASKGY